MGESYIAKIYVLNLKWSWMHKIQKLKTNLFLLPLKNCEAVLSIDYWVVCEL